MTPIQVPSGRQMPTCAPGQLNLVRVESSTAWNCVWVALSKACSVADALALGSDEDELEQPASSKPAVDAAATPIRSRRPIVCLSLCL
ncbi:MAG: hypothetical protein ACOYD1_12350 [Candidatus Nanopelagicales bacterium]